MIVPSKAKKFQKLPGREQVKREDNSKPANGYRGGGLGEKRLGKIVGDWNAWLEVKSR